MGFFTFIFLIALGFAFWKVLAPAKQATETAITASVQTISNTMTGIADVSKALSSELTTVSRDLMADSLKSRTTANTKFKEAASSFDKKEDSDITEYIRSL